MQEIELIQHRKGIIGNVHNLLGWSNWTTFYQTIDDREVLQAL